MNSTDSNNDSPIRIGISSCLLGQEVRFDGQHKHDCYLTDTLGEYFEWVPVCPEVEGGLGTPREPFKLVQLENSINLKTTRSKVDLTKQWSHFPSDECCCLCSNSDDTPIAKIVYCHITVGV